MLTTKKLISLLLFTLALVWITPNVCAITSSGDSTRSLSGTYHFHGSLKNRGGRSIPVSGDLDFDWLGDISGEAVSSLSTPRRDSPPEVVCRFLIMGNYVLDQQNYAATLTFSPVSTACPFRQDETLHVTIVPHHDKGAIELSQIGPGRHEFSGLARLESPGPL